MGYCTTTALDTYLIGYASSNSSTASVIGQAITQADAKINAYLSVVFDVSSWTTTTPPMVRSLSERLSSAYTIEALSRGSKESLARAKQLKEEVFEDLSMMKAGELALVDTAGSSISEDNDPMSSYSTTEDYSNTFNEDKPTHWKIDATKKIDISAERI